MNKFLVESVERKKVSGESECRITGNENIRIYHLEKAQRAQGHKSTKA
jgi:hypothetical protein